MLATEGVVSCGRGFCRNKKSQKETSCWTMHVTAPELCAQHHNCFVGSIPRPNTVTSPSSSKTCSSFSQARPCFAPSIARLVEALLAGEEPLRAELRLGGASCK